MAANKDIWCPAIVRAPIGQILAQGSLYGFEMEWLPRLPAFRFLADPFGLWQDGLLYVFVESYDYRVRIGTIEVLIYDAELRLVDRRQALSEAWHLSYPQVFKADGAIWMLPESARSGELRLYRARTFPDLWEQAATLTLDHLALDPSILHVDGLWWLFYTSADREIDKQTALHVAWAENLMGPWHADPRNPVRVDSASARPGGTPCVIDGRVMLPVQDCSRTYGGAIRPLWFDSLAPGEVRCHAGEPLYPRADFAPFLDGLHTLSAAGEFTLIDVKQQVLSPHGLALELQWELHKFIHRRHGGRR